MYQDWMEKMPIIISSENKGNKNKSIEKLQTDVDDIYYVLMKGAKYVVFKNVRNINVNFI